MKTVADIHNKNIITHLKINFQQIYQHVVVIVKMLPR